MSLFMIFSVPLFFLFVVLLPWQEAEPSRGLRLASVFAYGFLCSLPGYIILLIVGAIVGQPLTGFASCVAGFFREHYAPLALGIGAFLLVQKKLDFPTTEAGIFLTTLTFLCGFYAILGIARFIALYPQCGSDDFFLLPLLRLTAVFAASLAASRFYPWQGRAAAGYLALAAFFCLVLTAASWAYGAGYRWVSFVLGVGVFGVCAVSFGRSFPQTLSLQWSHGRPRATLQK